MTTLGRLGNTTEIFILDCFLNFLLSACVLIHVFTGLSFFGDPISGELCVQTPDLQ